MSNASALQALEYEAETTFGEDVTTFATHRIPIVGQIDLSGIKHDKIPSQRVVQRLQEGTKHILGPMEGSFKLKIWATGHGATTVGAPTVDAMETFLSYVFGTPASNGTLSAANSTTFTGAGTATAPTTTASGTFAAGGLVRAGAKGDGRADGQAYAVATHAATTLNMLTALAGVPSNGDVLAPMVNFFFPEDPTGAATAVTGLRFRFRSANLGVELHGCYATSVTLGGTNTGELPYWEITFGVSWWRYTATSGVSAVTSNQYNPAPCAQGSVAIHDVGTATRVTYSTRSFALTITLGVQPLDAPGGAGQYQKITGAKRIPSMVRVKLMIDADAATATPTFDSWFTAGTAKHILYTLSTTAGSMVAIYLRNVNICGARPIQIANSNVNRLEIDGECNTSTTTTNDLTLSALTVGYA